MRLNSSAVGVVLMAGLVSVALANPTGAKVVSGTASVSSSGNTLAVQNNSGTIINWQTFNISSSEVTRFVQTSASSSVLNRVVTADPSKILGSLQSNGRVVLTNPSYSVSTSGGAITLTGSTGVILTGSTGGNLTLTGSTGGNKTLTGSAAGNLTLTSGGAVTGNLTLTASSNNVTTGTAAPPVVGSITIGGALNPSSPVGTITLQAPGACAANSVGCSGTLMVSAGQVSVPPNPGMNVTPAYFGGTLVLSPGAPQIGGTSISAASSSGKINLAARTGVATANLNPAVMVLAGSTASPRPMAPAQGTIAVVPQVAAAPAALSLNLEKREISF